MAYKRTRMGKHSPSKGRRRKDVTARTENLKLSGGKSVLWGLIGAYLLTMGGLLLCSLLLDWGILSGTQNQYVLLVMMISLVSIFAGSFVAARMSGEEGWKYGLVTGILYLVIRFFISWLINGADIFVGNIWLESASCLAMSGLGTILGKKKRKK